MKSTLVSKLVRRNLVSPINARIALSDVQDSVSIASVRGSLFALMATIHGEIAPQLREMRRLDLIMGDSGRGAPTKDASEKRIPSRKGASVFNHVYSMGDLRGTESLVSSDSFEACALNGMDKAEETTRHIADNN